MQMESERRPNAERSAQMRARLIAAARALFAERGYAETSTPAIVAAAGVTRGALYHHFADKPAILAAVCAAEAEAVAAAMAEADQDAQTPLDRLKAGARAWLRSMAVPGRARLLLLDGPAILGAGAFADAAGEGALREGLAEAMAAGSIRPLPLDATVALLSALFDRAALLELAGRPVEEAESVVFAVLEGLAYPAAAGGVQRP